MDLDPKINKCHAVILQKVAAHLISQSVDVDLTFFLLLRQVEHWSSHQQEISVPVCVNVYRAQLRTKVGSNLTK